MTNSEFHDRLVGEFSELAAADSDDLELIRLALLVCKDEYTGLDIESKEQELQSLADLLNESLKLSDLRYNVRRIIRTMALTMFREFGFGLDAEYPDDPQNLYLNRVLERRKGVGVTLSLLYSEVGKRAGLDIRPVALPGYMLCRFYPDLTRSQEYEEMPEILLDPSAGGRSIRRQDAHILIRNRFGGRISLEDRFFYPIQPRQFIQRLLRLLKTIYLQRGEDDRAASVIDFLVAMYPWDLDEMRDRGMLRAKTDDAREALDDLEPYLQFRHDAKDIGTIREIVLSLREHLESSEDLNTLN